jgi:hypothetical protein
MAKHLGSLGFCGSYVFWCRVGLKLFLGLSRAKGDEYTKFGVLLRSFATFSGLIEFPCKVTALLQKSFTRRLRKGLGGRQDFQLPQLILQINRVVHFLLTEAVTNNYLG